MTSGVFRPYTLADVLGTIQQQGVSGAAASTTSSGIGIFAEADETWPLLDSWISTVQPTPGWDGGVWGGTTWQ